MVYYGAIYAICAKVLKQNQWALVMLLFSVGMVTDTFYWIQSEFPQGIAFTILFFAAWNNYKTPQLSGIALAVFFLMLLTVAFFHPLLLIVFLFLMGFTYLSNKEAINQPLAIASLVFVFVILFFKTLVLTAQYEAQAMGGLRNFFTLFPNYFTIASNKNFIISLFTDFYFLAVGWGILVWFYVKQKEHLKLIFVGIFWVGYLGLINVSYAHGAEPFYIENLYLPLSLFLIVPIVFDVLPTLKVKYQLGIIGAILLLRVVHIGFNHQPYTERLDWQRQFMQQQTTEKVLVADTKVSMDSLWMSWGSVYEFWLLSTIETGQTASILIDDKTQIQQLEWATGKTDALITKWGVFDYQQLPERYFKFEHREKGYVIVR